VKEEKATANSPSEDGIHSFMSRCIYAPCSNLRIRHKIRGNCRSRRQNRGLK